MPTGVEIPGQVLPAGPYLFKLADSNNMNVVRVFSADGTRLYATLETVSAERTDPAGDMEITLAEQPNGRPMALLKWFYPGKLTGHEFIYPKQEELQLAQSRKQTDRRKGIYSSGRLRGSAWHLFAGMPGQHRRTFHPIFRYQKPVHHFLTTIRQPSNAWAILRVEISTTDLNVGNNISPILHRGPGTVVLARTTRFPAPGPESAPLRKSLSRS